MVNERSHCVLISVLYCRQTKSWKIADFGLTAEATSRLPITTRFIRGTAGYRAPELLTSSKFTNKVDIWALGCIIYELATGRMAFCDDFAVKGSPDSTLQISISLLPENHLTYLSDCVHEMLDRNPEQRPPISIVLALVKSYSILLDLQILQKSQLIPSYHQWKELVGEKPRDVTAFFSDLVDWYHSGKQNDALIQLLTALAKRFPDIRKFREQLAKVYEEMGSWNMAIETWKDLVDKYPSDEALYGKLAYALLSHHDCRLLSRVLKELAEKHPENTQTTVLETAPHEVNHEYNNIAVVASAKRGSLNGISSLEHPATDVNARDKDGATALHRAAQRGDKELVKSLLQAEAEVDSKDKWGQTPLSYAAAKGQLDVARILLEAGAEVDSKDKIGWTPLSRAAEKGHTDVARALLQAGAEVDLEDFGGQTPLSWAAYWGYADVAKILLEAGAEVDSIDREWGRTPLSWAAANGHADVAKILLEAGAEVDSKSNSGMTPLSWAAYWGHVEAVKFLAEEAGADVESKDNDGRTALDLARQGERWRPEECRAVAAWLETKGAGEAGA